MTSTNDGKTFYSIYREPSYMEKQRGLTLGACITEAESREEAIRKTEDYLTEKSGEDGEYGEHEDDFILITHVYDTGAETEEKITISWEVEEDTYDGGRFDYLAGIGAIRSC